MDRRGVLTLLLVFSFLLVMSFNTDYFEDVRLAPLNNQILILHLDGSIADSSPESNPVNILSSVPTYVSEGALNGAFQFSGNNALQVPDTNSLSDPNEMNMPLDLQSSFSISSWVYLTQSPGSGKWRSIVSKGDPESLNFPENYNYLLAYNNDGIISGSQGFIFGFQDSAGNGCFANSADNELTNQWYLVTGVFDNNQDKLRLYVDGNLQSEVTCTLTPNTNNYDVLIANDNADSGRGWKGIIDEVFIYNRVLTQNDIDTIYNACSSNEECSIPVEEYVCIDGDSYFRTTYSQCLPDNTCSSQIVDETLYESCQQGCDILTGLCIESCTENDLSQCENSGEVTSELSCDSGNVVNITRTPFCNPTNNCDTSVNQAIHETCSFGCDNGACLELYEDQTCSDSDAGKDFNVFGEVIVEFDNGTEINYEDACEDSSKLKEYFCESNAKQSIQQICDLGCSQGSCTIDDSNNSDYDPNPTICTSGEEKCEFSQYYYCSNNDWIGPDLVIGKCGYEVKDNVVIAEGAPCNFDSDCSSDEICGFGDTCQSVSSQYQEPSSGNWIYFVIALLVVGIITILVYILHRKGVTKKLGKVSKYLRDRPGRKHIGRNLHRVPAHYKSRKR